MSTVTIYVTGTSAEFVTKWMNTIGSVNDNMTVNAIYKTTIEPTATRSVVIKWISKPETITDAINWIHNASQCNKIFVVQKAGTGADVRDQLKRIVKDPTHVLFAVGHSENSVKMYDDHRDIFEYIIGPGEFVKDDVELPKPIEDNMTEDQLIEKLKAMYEAKIVGLNKCRDLCKSCPIPEEIIMKLVAVLDTAVDEVSLKARNAFNKN